MENKETIMEIQEIQQSKLQTNVQDILQLLQVSQEKQHQQNMEFQAKQHLQTMEANNTMLERFMVLSSENTKQILNSQYEAQMKAQESQQRFQLESQQQAMTMLMQLGTLQKKQHIGNQLAIDNKEKVQNVIINQNSFVCDPQTGRPYLCTFTGCKEPKEYFAPGSNFSQFRKCHCFVHYKHAGKKNSGGVCSEHQEVRFPKSGQIQAIFVKKLTMYSTGTGNYKDMLNFSIADQEKDDKMVADDVEEVDSDVSVEINKND